MWGAWWPNWMTCQVLAACCLLPLNPSQGLILPLCQLISPVSELSVVFLFTPMKGHFFVLSLYSIFFLPHTPRIDVFSPTFLVAISWKARLGVSSGIPTLSDNRPGDLSTLDKARVPGTNARLKILSWPPGTVHAGCVFRSTSCQTVGAAVVTGMDLVGGPASQKGGWNLHGEVWRQHLALFFPQLF